MKKVIKKGVILVGISAMLIGLIGCTNNKISNLNNDEENECDTLTFDTPHRRMELSETANLYLQALNKLPYTWQRILLMRGEEEKSYAEIAEILGTSDSSVRATLCKAKKKIMQYINHDL